MQAMVATATVSDSSWTGRRLAKREKQGERQSWKTPPKEQRAGHRRSGRALQQLQGSLQLQSKRRRR